MLNRVTQYEETIQQYDARIARMKNEMRRLQTNMDTTCKYKFVNLKTHHVKVLIMILIG